jgi:hypothetical protein
MLTKYDNSCVPIVELSPAPKEDPKLSFSLTPYDYESRDEQLHQGKRAMFWDKLQDSGIKCNLFGTKINHVNNNCKVMEEAATAAITDLCNDFGIKNT